MASFRKARDELLVSFCEEIINEDEFLLLYDANKSKNPKYPYCNNEIFTLQCKSEAKCKTDFCFEKCDIDVLGLLDEIKCNQGTICDSTEGLCTVLKRLTYLCRYSDLISIFGRPVPEISMISNTVFDFIFEHHGRRMSEWNHTILNPMHYRHMLKLFQIKVRPSTIVNFGVVDDTVRPICHPNTKELFTMGTRGCMP